MFLRKDHGYCLAFISQAHELPMQLIKDAELILAFELKANDATNYNMVSHKLNVELMTIAVLQMVCDRYERNVDFSLFIQRNSLDVHQIEYMVKQMSARYQAGIMPANVTPSATCTMILGDYEF